ncbi:MAG TPA: hypothetical protein VD931_06560 [Baekduia sp.]|nr:hypothetical protein [Baekduia sp.]
MSDAPLLNELRRLLAEALPGLADPLPLQAERVACLAGVPLVEDPDMHEVVVGELAAKGSPEAGAVLRALSRLFPDPEGRAAAAADALGAGPAPAFEVRRAVRLEAPDLALVGAEVHAGGAVFAPRVIWDETGLRGYFGPDAPAEEVQAALDEVVEDGAEAVHPSVAAAALKDLLREALEAEVPADEMLTIEGPLVVHALGLEPEAWPDLPMLPDPEPEATPKAPPRPPADPRTKKAKRRSQKAARKRNR